MFSKHLRGKQDDADADDDDNKDNDDGDSDDEDDGDQNRKCVAADLRIIAGTVDRRVAGSKGGASWASQHDRDEDEDFEVLGVCHADADLPQPIHAAQVRQLLRLFLISDEHDLEEVALCRPQDLVVAA